MPRYVRTMHNDVFLRLLNQAKLPPEEVASRCADALRPEYWRRLSPELSIQGSCPAEIAEASCLGHERIAALAASVTSDGYFETGPLYSPSVIAGMRVAVESLKDGGWPPVFAFVYDQFWSLLRSPSMSTFLSTVLGLGYRQTAQIWLHYVFPHSGTPGWLPHFDAPHRTNRLTVWIALSDATLDNGCMYVAPRPSVSREFMDAFNENLPVKMEEFKAVLHACRAVPVRSGAAIGWDCDIMHWGSPYVRGKPRIAFSQVFMSAQQSAARDEVPEWPGDGPLPDFQQRLYVIAEAIKYYRRFEPLLIRYCDLAQRLSDLTKAERE